MGVVQGDVLEEQSLCLWMVSMNVLSHARQLAVRTFSFSYHDTKEDIEMKTDVFVFVPGSIFERGNGTSIFLFVHQRVEPSR